MAVTQHIRKIHNTEQHIEAGPGCVGFWVDSNNVLKFKDDQGNVYVVYAPTAGTSGFGTQMRFKGTFDASDTLSFLFVRDIAVVVDGDSITFSAGEITAADVGRLISWTGFSGVVASLDSGTSATVFTISGTPGSGAVTASVGEAMEDDLFEVVAITSDALEIFASGNKSSSGFDIYSSNAASEADVVVTVIR